MRCPDLFKISALLGALAATAAASASANNDGHVPRQAGGCNVRTFATGLPAAAKVERVEHVSAGGTFGEPLTDLMYPIPPTNLPELCAVIIAVASSPVSVYRFGIFLPTQWSGRFLAVGNGGFGGGINWLDMGAAVQQGFAVISTDTGHNSTTTDTSWALGHPEMKTDWGWRALHGSVELGKALVRVFYSRPISYSYYSGCSTGGRQGLKETQISPDSFDGVLVGAAAWYTNHLNTWVCKIASYNWPADDPKHIDWETLPLIGIEITRQCDGVDGVTDGIISSPEQCNIDYNALRCNTSDNAPSNFSSSTSCLNDAQVETLRSVYNGYVLDATGEQVAQGYLPGSEFQLYTVLNYSDASPYGVGYVGDFVLNNPNFEASQYNDSILRLAERLDPGNATADDYNLTTFRDRGGKMLLYHGAADGLVPPTAAGTYYDRAVNATSDGNVTAARDFFRRLEIPGMKHCALSSVSAPWAIGGASQAAVLGNDTYSVPGFADSQHDVLLALIDWVEKGIPIDQVVATTWNNETDASSGVLRQRPICTYPQTAHWDGKGNVDEATSWSCSTEPSHGAGSTTGPSYASLFPIVMGAFIVLSSI
ncbi:tannase-domain-containing protein [Hypoxylon sp. FL1284]|nr:tannase-domain-containing protein [Hypoxylon sp. FL1284]